MSDQSLIDKISKVLSNNSCSELMDQLEPLIKYHEAPINTSVEEWQLREAIDSVTDKDYADSFELATHIIEALRPYLAQTKASVPDYIRIRLAQIASGDYKSCGLTAEEVAADALKFMEDASTRKDEDSEQPTVTESSTKASVSSETEVLTRKEKSFPEKNPGLISTSSTNLPSTLIQLLPCPFCGHPADICETSKGNGSIYCPDDDCAMNVETSFVPISKSYAIAAWNKRHQPSEKYLRSQTREQGEMLDSDDVEALLIAYDHAKDNKLPLTAIQPNIDIVRELLANIPKREMVTQKKAVDSCED